MSTLLPTVCVFYSDGMLLCQTYDKRKNWRHYTDLSAFFRDILDLIKNPHLFMELKDHFDLKIALTFPSLV